MPALTRRPAENNSGQRAGVGQASMEETAGRTDAAGGRLQRYGDLRDRTRTERGEEDVQSAGDVGSMLAMGVDTPEFSVRLRAEYDGITA